jgi:hypothetical protein
VARAVLQHFPYAYCFSCLATQLGSTEPDVRSAAQILIMQDAFRTIPRLCYGCSRTGVTLVPDKTLHD